jgi:hypothetical protein
LIDVFISYKQQEREAVQIIADTLEDLKLTVWFDTRLRAGTTFDEEIAAALRIAKAILVCWTPAAIQSEWVRSEAAEGLKTDRLVSCFLQPTDLIPPFNLTHAEALSAWAGQTDDPAWNKLLGRIGELVGRPGLTTYHAVMRTGASIEEMKDWTNANGADPLADAMWARIALLEGEGAETRLARVKAEARAAAEKRKAQAEKSRRLARERGLRDPTRERRRFQMLAGSVAVVGLLSAGSIWYFVDEQARDLMLRDEVTTTEKARAFLTANAWHPIAGRARDKLDRLDAEAWLAAKTDGSIKALQAYFADAQGSPQGKFLGEARKMLHSAEQVRGVQRSLARMRFYDGPVDGAFDRATQEAIALFRYRSNMQVSKTIDDELLHELDEALEWWTRPRLEELRAQSLEPPKEADYVRFAEQLGIDAATIRTLIEVESGPKGSGFSADRRPIICFEGIAFSQLTNHRYDAIHPATKALCTGKQDEEFNRLSEAYALDPNAALQATDWGALQVSGSNYKRYGYETVGEFVRALSQSAVSQQETEFVSGMRSFRVVDTLRRHDWAEFASRYIGPGYKINKYDERLSVAYKRASAEIAGLTAPGWATSQAARSPEQ